MQVPIMIFTSIVVFLVGFLMGWKVREIHAIHRGRQIIRKLAEEEAKQIKDNYIKIKMELVGDEIFVYSGEDHMFLAQGSSLKEVEEKLNERFPGKKYLIEEGNAEEVGLK